MADRLTFGPFTEGDPVGEAWYNAVTDSINDAGHGDLQQSFTLAGSEKNNASYLVQGTVAASGAPGWVDKELRRLGGDHVQSIVTEVMGALGATLTMTLYRRFNGTREQVAQATHVIAAAMTWEDATLPVAAVLTNGAPYWLTYSWSVTGFTLGGGNIVYSREG